MTEQRGRYYLSRVIKLGSLTQEKLAQAILGAPVLPIGMFQWAITDTVDGRESDPRFLFGKLAKYSSEGRVTVVDPEKKSQLNAPAPNLLVASAPFVYLPEFSGIAFLHVWNGIQEDLFPKRFCSLIAEAYQNFFVECTVEPVADYRAFVEKLDNLDRITEMSAKVHPPNPLFGRLWGSLKDYLAQRNAEEIAVREKKTDGDGLRTELLALIHGILEEQTSAGKNAVTRKVDITDAAMLMAADGYGHGKVIGEQKGEKVIIRTMDTHKSFLHAKDPVPAELASAAAILFKRISSERHMEH